MTDWALILGIIGTVLASAGLIWNISNVLSERRARRNPDVHGSVVLNRPGENSALAFINAGPGIARHVTFLLVENGVVYQGGIGTAFLTAEAHAELPLNFESTKERSTVVWAYMDIDGNVHARSNDGQRTTYKHPADVEIGDVFHRFYPSESLPSRPLLASLGE